MPIRKTKGTSKASIAALRENTVNLFAVERIGREPAKQAWEGESGLEIHFQL